MSTGMDTGAASTRFIDCGTCTTRYQASRSECPTCTARAESEAFRIAAAKSAADTFRVIDYIRSMDCDD